MFGSKKIAIDKTLWERVERVAKQAGYASVEEFVIHTLEQNVRHIEEAKDEDDVRERLKGLGYID